MANTVSILSTFLIDLCGLSLAELEKHKLTRQPLQRWEEERLVMRILII